MTGSQSRDTERNELVRGEGADASTLSTLDDATRELVRLGALICVADERALRSALQRAVGSVEPTWVEELLLQSYLFAGLPRALNAMREWRRASGRSAPAADADAARDETGAWRERGEATCAAVYGQFYEPLRRNIAELHPALDAWMIVEGYGKVLSRPGLDLARRELCIVAACAALGQDRQLHSHLHGAVNVGVAPAVVGATLDALGGVVGETELDRARRLWTRVRDHGHGRR